MARWATIFLALGACQSTQPSGSGPIVAPGGEWTWVDFDDTACANGAPTGLAVNPKDGATDVVIYLMGGGACWDYGTCYAAPLAWNISLGYGASSFATEPLRDAALFDRTSSTNPFRDATYVFVPYCTGDVHAGTAEASYSAGQTTRHVGAKNLDAYLERLKPTFGGAARVFVIGTSAGGFGAQLNAQRFARAFSPVPVHVLADSAAMVEPANGLWSKWLAAWQPQAPDGCDGCSSGPQAWVGAARDALGAGRLGLVSAQQDWLISTFAGLSGDAFETELSALVGAELDRPGAAAFVVPGTQHVFLTSFASVKAQDGTALTDWLQAFHDGSAGFTTVMPAHQ